MLLIAEVIMLIVGIVLMINGRIDTGPLKGEGPGVRRAGLVLALPLLIAFPVGFIIGVTNPNAIRTGALAITCAEFIGVVAALIIAYNMINRARLPDTARSTPSVMTVSEAAAF